ncbi:DUF6575 domain-containing protein [Haemophilus haemolyticus]|jgi:hypothetical protein|uniref:DUF6575 domain-containing protein n=1 Tax=Haemophilus haemolyticus TaxID=726 RepID=UPI00062D9025|nr:DUF6575 domain-containing protein [Haemophilus haemolyticus]KKZ53907.1 hypothetical protein AAX15_06910 [Haemophilus haemolyticus]
MTNKNLLFVNNPKFGKLNYHNVYTYYDEPLMFSAKNEFGHIYFCYSLGCDKTHDRWLIIPTTPEHINRFEQKDISISSMIRGSLKGKITYLLKFDLDNLEQSLSLLEEGDFNYKLPNDDLFIHENINYDGTRDYTHRIRIAVNDKSNQTISIINNISESFGLLLNNAFKSMFNIKTSFLLRDAVPGSYVQRVKTELSSKEIQKEDLLPLFHGGLAKLSNKDEMSELVTNNVLDLKIIRELVDKLSSYKADIQVIDETTTKTVFNLKYDIAEQLLPIINNKLENHLDSSMVPQANSLDLVKNYVGALKKRGIVTVDDLTGLTTSRQVLYYKDACRILNLIKDGYLTPQGQRIAELDVRSEWLAIIKSEFENSYCGYLWMKSQNVSSVTDITNETSAIQFLKEKATGLSENTSERRARTLINWLREFKQLV